MTDQTVSTAPLDDLTAPALAASPQAKRSRTVFAGYTAVQLLVGAAVLLALVWGMWVTKTVIGEPPQRIVKADLSRIVGDYVTVQARSGGSPEQVQAQMREFMASLDTELQRRGAKGQVVLVGEAVLSKSIPDITPDVVNAVYASGVKRPQPASPAQVGAVLGQQGAVSVQPSPTHLAQVAGTVPQGSPTLFGPIPSPTPMAPSVDPTMTGPAVPSFGGPGGQ